MRLNSVFSTIAMLLAIATLSVLVWFDFTAQISASPSPGKLGQGDAASYDAPHLGSGKLGVESRMPGQTRSSGPVALGLAGAGPIDVEPTAAGHNHRDERPLPAFDGVGIFGKPMSISDFLGKRLVLFFFNPEVKEAEIAAEAIGRIAEFQTQSNFQIVGVAIGTTTYAAKEFVRKHSLDFPVFDDSRGSITRILGIRSPVIVYHFDSDGYFESAIPYFPTEVPDPVGFTEDQLREKLRLSARQSEQLGILDPRPMAPDFSARQIDSGERFELSSTKGEPLVLIFFLHTCPHCHAALKFYKEQLAKFPEDKRPKLVGISVQNRPSMVRDALKDLGLDYFPVLFDPDNKISEEYGVFAGFPDVLLIDETGKIVHRTQGWHEDRDPALNRMVLSKIAGTKIPMLLNPKGYTGSDVCSVCHELEAQSYQFTRHNNAYSTIVTHGETQNEECVSCHVVGFDKPGGFSLKERPKHLENVGCESCHGRGGPHLSKSFVPKRKDGTSDFKSICETCHNTTHSISFDYETFRKKISHVAIATLTNEERAGLIADGAKPRDVLPKNANYVGSAACESCHESEFKSWQGDPHRNSMASLVEKDKQDDADCLKCHTTGMGRPGGFPAEGKGDDSSHGDLATVGCESCHGPGGNHIAPSAPKLGTIVSLADKCDSCAILQICGSCHDDANDPGFEFEVDESVEKLRHGTIEAGTGKPIKPKSGDQSRIHRNPVSPVAWVQAGSSPEI
jgi:peroxiredoxin